MEPTRTRKGRVARQTLLPQQVQTESLAKAGQPARPLGIMIGENKECRDLLEREGMEVLGAKGSKEGLRLAQHEHPDLVAVDLGSLENEGKEVGLEMKLLPGLARVPVVAICATATAKDSISKRKIFDACVAAPIKADAFRRIIRELLGRRVTREIAARRDRPLKVKSGLRNAKKRQP